MDTSVHEWLKKKKREKESGSEKRRKKKFSAPLNELGTGRIYFFPQLAPPFTFYLRGILRENSACIHCRKREEGHSEKRRGKSTYCAVFLLFNNGIAWSRIYKSIARS